MLIYNVRYLLFWYHVFTWVSESPNLVANSILSWTLRYFCLAKCFSKLFNCWSVKAVLAFRGFLIFDTISCRCFSFWKSLKIEWTKDKNINYLFFNYLNALAYQFKRICLEFFPSSNDICTYIVHTWWWASFRDSCVYLIVRVIHWY